MFASGFTWFHLIPFVDKDEPVKALGISEHMLNETIGKELMVPNTSTHLHAWLACFLLIGFALIARMGLEKAKKSQGMSKYYAEDKLTFRTVGEIFVGGIQGMMGELLSASDVKLFMPLIGGLFAYIFANNIMGIFPGFAPATDNINTNIGMALVVFVVFNVVGMTRDAKNYINHLLGPMALLIPLMLPIELVSLIFRPISLTIRLTGNMFGDHKVFSVLSGLIPVFLPTALLALATLVSFIQAFIFSLLTTIYIHLSLPHDDHSDHGEAGAH